MKEPFDPMKNIFQIIHITPLFKILSILSSDVADKADRSESYLNEPLFGGTEFVVNDYKGERLAFASRIEGLMNVYQWEVSLD